jgi:hypothetical protein
MQGGDLGSHWSKKFVVTAVPTLFLPPPESYRFHLGSRQFGKKDKVVAEFELNRAMVQWIVNIGRQSNIPTEVWTFIQDDEIVERLADRLDRHASNAIVGWQQWESIEDAQLELRIDASIHTVYDAEPGRADAWGMRAHRLLRGGAPTS